MWDEVGLNDSFGTVLSSLGSPWMAKAVPAAAYFQKLPEHVKHKSVMPLDRSGWSLLFATIFLKYPLGKWKKCLAGKVHCIE